MFYRKALSLSIALLSIAVVAASFYQSGDHGFHIPFMRSGPVHSLTGLSGNESPVIVVKIDDTSYAHPQVGLQSADIVYIEQVEGGLTRLAAVYSSELPPIVGPVRSARISDIDLLAQYGKVGFAYSGAQSKFLPVLAASNIFDLGATHFGPSYYSNDPLRIVPYAMMLKLPEILQAAKDNGMSIVNSGSIGFEFGSLSATGSTFDSVHISWPTVGYDARWSPELEKFLLFYNGQPDVDENGNQLAVDNLLIQKVSVTDSIYKDKVGGITPLIATIGEGDCFLLRNSIAIACHWSRKSPEDGTHIFNDQGEGLTLQPGKTWVALTSKEPVFSGLQSDLASSTKSK